MKHPLLRVALVYSVGLLLADHFQPPLFFLFATSLALVLAALLAGKLRPFLIWPFVLFVGWTNLVSRTAVISPDDLRILQTNSAEIVTIRGTLAETPTQRVFLRNDEESFRTLAQVRVDKLRKGENWLPAFGKVFVTTPGTLPKEFFSGQTVEITGVLAPPPTPLAEGLFDFRTYLRRQGIYFELKASSLSDWQIISTNRNPPLSDRFLAWAQLTLARDLPDVDESLRLLWAMTLGWKTALTNEVSEPFMRSGTMHIFAISGLHIALIAGILVALLRVLRLPRGWCGVVVIPLIWFYTAATGWQSSAIRSTVMMTIIIGGWSLKRPSDLVNSLAAAALIILLWDPQQLFQASFQLSFFVVLAIALFLPPLEKIRDRLLRPDPFLPAELIPRWQRWFGGVLRFLVTALATSLAAWLGSWPLCAYYFHLFSPVTLLANLIIVPLSSAALASNLGSLICGDWFPWATAMFNHSGWFWMWLMNRISLWTTQLPGAFFYTRGPWLVDFFIYYGALFAVLSGVAFRKRWRVPAIICVVCIGGFYCWRVENNRNSISLTVIPLGGGSSVFVHGGDRSKNLLVDCGNTNSVEWVVKPFLRAQGVNRLPQLVLTHGDLKHVGGTKLLTDLFPIDEIVTSSIHFKSPTYRKILEELGRNENRWRMIHRGDEFGAWAVEHPLPTDSFPQGDDAALVLRGNFHGARVLLLSDLGRPGQNALLERASDLRADIVVAGLPQRGEPLCDALLDAVQPRVIIVTDSEYPATMRASAKLRERLAARNVPVIYTRTSGGVKITVGAEKWELKTQDGFRLNGANNNR